MCASHSHVCVPQAAALLLLFSVAGAAQEPDRYAPRDPLSLTLPRRPVTRRDYVEFLRPFATDYRDDARGRSMGLASRATSSHAAAGRIRAGRRSRAGTARQSRPAHVCPVGRSVRRHEGRRVLPGCGHLLHLVRAGTPPARPADRGR